MKPVNLAKLVFLIDPDDPNDPEMELAQAVIEHRKSREEVYDIWIGCSTTSGEDLAKVALSLSEQDVAFSVYPGSPDQVTSTIYISSGYFVPMPVYYNPKLEVLAKPFKELLMEELERSKKPYEVMAYLLTHPNCTTAKILGIDGFDPDHEIFSDDFLLGRLDGVWSRVIYIEGGSRNIGNGINQRMALAERVRRMYPDSHIIGAGGIRSPADALELHQTGYFNTVLVSGDIHAKAGNSSMQETLDYLDEYVEVLR